MKRNSPSVRTNLLGVLNGDTPAKNPKLSDNSNKVVESGASPYFKSGRQTLIEAAWESKNYDEVLSLLKKDKSFPKTFSIDHLNNADKAQKLLKKFVEKRIAFHGLIEAGNLEEVKDMVDRTAEKSKLYLNVNNESACYAALKHNQYGIYAYLASVDVKFKSDKEKEILSNLDEAELFKLRSEKEQYFPQKKNGHIDYLMSVSYSKTEGQQKQLENNLRKWYEELDKIPEVSIILKVLQYSDFLRITFDFDGKDTSDVSCLQSNKLGDTWFTEGKVCIAASNKLGKTNILGAIAHELAHMAMQITYDNMCNPYFSNNEDEEIEFKNIVKDLEEKSKRHHFRSPRKTMPDHIHGTPEETLLGFMKYSKEDRPSEAIVRVPQILAQYPYGGKSWLETYTDDLYKYYLDNVTRNFAKVLKNSVNKKSADTNKQLNKTYVEANKIKDYRVVFENLDSLTDYFKFKKNILLLYSENVVLTLLRVLQGLYGRNFENESSEYALFKLNNIHIQEFHDVFFSEPAKVGIIENSDQSCTEKKIQKIFNTLQELLNKRPHLKFIIITGKNGENIKNVLGLKSLDFTEGNDIGFCLNDLDNESKEDIMAKEIIFQGSNKPIEFRDLLENGEEFMTTIKINIIEKLCREGNIEIGGGIIGTSSLEGAYADVLQEIDGNFKDKLTSNDVFVIEGITQSNKKDELINHLGLSETPVINQRDDYTKDIKNGKRVFLADYDLTDDDFKKFCRNYEGIKNENKEKFFLKNERKFFWVSLNKKRVKGDPKFLLKQCYYPDFYMKRKFKEKVILKNKINDLPRSRNPDIIVIGCKENEKRLLNNVTYPHVQIFDIKDAQVHFDELCLQNKTVHLLKIKHGELIWKNSNGSIINLKKCLNQKVGSKFHISEKDFIEEIFDKRIVLISDDPGMGKSTTITKLYEEKFGENTLIDTRWIIRINLKDHLKAIRKIKREAFDLKKVLNFLCDVDSNLNNDLCRELLNFALDKRKTFTRPLLIVFDGFDELSDESSRQKIHLLLQFLKKETKCKLWVTTRRHYKDELEKELNTLAMEFFPVKEEEMRKFIRKYLYHRLSLVLTKEKSFLIFGRNENLSKGMILWDYAKKFIEKMKLIFKKDTAKFIGAPLQLCLMLENAVKHFKNFALENRLDLSFFGNAPNILDIYKKFIEMKYLVYFRKKNSDDEFFQKCVSKFAGDYCKTLAESLTLNNEFKISNEEDTVNMLSIGIIKRQNENLEFIHFTFREYFSAQVFIEYLKDERFKNKDFNLAEILVKNIFLQPDYQLMRTFINLHLEKLEIKELPKDVLKEIGKMVALLWGKKPCLIVNEGTVLHVALDEGNMKIYDLIFLSCEEIFTDEIYGQFLQIKNKRQQTLFHIAVLMNETNIIETLTKIVRKRLKPQLGLEVLEIKDKNGTALKLAENRKNDRIVRLLKAVQEDLILLSDLA